VGRKRDAARGDCSDAAPQDFGRLERPPDDGAFVDPATPGDSPPTSTRTPRSAIPADRGRHIRGVLRRRMRLLRPKPGAARAEQRKTLPRPCDRQRGESQGRGGEVPSRAAVGLARSSVALDGLRCKALPGTARASRRKTTSSIPQSRWGLLDLLLPSQRGGSLSRKVSSNPSGQGERGAFAAIQPLSLLHPPLDPPGPRHPISGSGMR
jgi:hypothetical protein